MFDVGVGSCLKASACKGCHAWNSGSSVQGLLVAGPTSSMNPRQGELIIVYLIRKADSSAWSCGVLAGRVQMLLHNPVTPIYWHLSTI